MNSVWIVVIAVGVLLGVAHADDKQVWGHKYCEWAELEKHRGVRCESNFTFVCVHGPVFVPCMRLEFHIYGSMDRTEFGVECRFAGQRSTLCPFGSYTSSAPCVIKESFEPVPSDAQGVGCTTFTRSNTTYACLTWKHAFVDLCHDDFDMPDTFRTVSRRSRYYHPVNWDHPVIQKDMKEHPEHFAQYTPHARHPRVQHASHLLHNRRPMRTLQAKKRLPLSHVLAYAGRPTEDLPEDWRNATLHDHDLPSWDEPVTHYFRYPKATEHERTKHTEHHHTHTFRWENIPIPKLPEPHHPHLTYIQTYEHHHSPVMKLVPGHGVYRADYTELDHLNQVHPFNLAWSEDDYPDVHERHAAIFEYRNLKQHEQANYMMQEYGHTVRPAPAPFKEDI